MLSKASELLPSVFAEALRPKPYLPVPEWAGRYRYVPSKSSSSPGYWDNGKTPYLAEIMLALSPLSGTKDVAFQKPTQVGGTEVAVNLIGYHMHYWPRGMMLVMQDEGTVKKTSKQKLTPTIEESPVLAELVSSKPGKKSSDNIYDKSAGSCERASLCLGAFIAIADEYSAWADDATGACNRANSVW